MADTPLPHDANHADLILASRVNGVSVYDTAGDRIGHIEDLSIDRVTGHVRYALMSFGGFLGIGDRIHPIPWGVLDYSIEHAGYVVPLSKVQLEGAPHYTPDQVAAFGGPEFNADDALIAYYRQFGYTPII
jgi:hypothetical protein